MPTRRRSDPTPDLFSSLPTASPPEHPPIPRGSVEAGVVPTQLRPLLPKDLAGALERLEDAEVDALLAAVNREARRRGRLRPTQPRGEQTAEARSAPRRVASHVDAGSLTTGKLNAVRAAFKAGIKPAAIARQFGISQADVKRALAAEKLNR